MVALHVTVRLLEGPFAGFAGRVASVDPKRGTAVVNVPIFGRMTPVELPADALELAEHDLPAGPAAPHDPTSILDDE